MLYTLHHKLSLICPVQVIDAWLYPGHSLYETLARRPEVDFFQWEVEPAGGDAEVGVMWGNVVYAVVSLGQDDVHLLEPFDPGWQGSVGVRPLVNLVGERDKEHERHQHHVEEVPRANLFGRPGQGGVQGTAQGCQSHQAVVTICLHKIVSGDGKRIDMMLSEWPDECLRRGERESVCVYVCVCVWGGGGGGGRGI